ncbi:MAG: hypothetical protein VW865_04610 [Halieaceae bacterium]
MKYFDGVNNNAWSRRGLLDRAVVTLNVVLGISTKGIMLDGMSSVADNKQHCRAQHQPGILFITAKRHRQTGPLQSVTVVGRG